MISERIVLHEDRNVTLTTYIQESSREFTFAKRPAIVILPGGGYGMCSDREAEPVALAYMNAGYNAFVLRYTLKQKGQWPLPLEDYDETMTLILDNAEKYGVDPERIAVVGFSAGGHLAACAATMAKHRPAAALLIYAATQRDILDMCCQNGLPMPEEYVDDLTPPCFFVAARDDRLVTMDNTLMMELALSKAGITYESHIYSYGGHGFSVATENLNGAEFCPRLPRWVSDSIEWLGEVMGRFTAEGFTEPLYDKMITGDKAKSLSVMASLGHIRKQSKEAQQELAILFDAISAYAKSAGFAEEKVYEYMSPLSVKEILQAVKTEASVIEELDRRLRKYPNER